MRTVKHEGKSWEVQFVKEKRVYACQGADEHKNPTSRFVVTEWLAPKGADVKCAELEREFDKVDFLWGWKNSFLFRETINSNGKEKDIETKVCQEKFEDGKWSVQNPSDHEAVLKDIKPDASSFAQTYQEVKDALEEKTGVAWYWAIIAIVAFILFVCALVITRWG